MATKKGDTDKPKNVRTPKAKASAKPPAKAAATPEAEAKAPVIRSIIPYTFVLDIDGGLVLARSLTTAIFSTYRQTLKGARKVVTYIVREGKVLRPKINPFEEDISESSWMKKERVRLRAELDASEIPMAPKTVATRVSKFLAEVEAEKKLEADRKAEAKVAKAEANRLAKEAAKKAAEEESK